jgi:antitoxin component YwqK of YwqJK toxin-antitoxin module
MPERELRTIEDDSGRKIGEAEYLDGKPHGVTKIWTPEGVLTQEAELEFGEYHGKYCAWWNNGKKKEEGRFYRGKRVGLYRWYSENGALLKEEDYGPSIL